MTPERAIEILNPEHREHYDSIEIVNEACRIGMDAIGYRIKKKPIYNDYTGLYVCPDCKKIIADSDDVSDFGDYCKFCGQALDWSDSNVKQEADN